ncbi:MAG: hypothetical protein JKX97_06465 [Candidatus Lindowbacteria bacterium]|nr:hypothetical protein [Candidatus Lindowbacteria bacterium]
MEIYLNGQPLDFEIEGESNLRDIIDSVSKWLYERGAVLISVRNGGHAIDFADDGVVGKIDLAKIEILEMESQNARLLVIETISELGQYLDRVARLAPQIGEDDISDESVNQLLEGIEWSVDVLLRVEEILQLKYSEIEIEDEKLHKRLLRLGDMRDHIEEAFNSKNQIALRLLMKESMAPLADSVVRALPKILDAAKLGKVVDDQLEELDEVLEAIKSLPENLERIAVKISIGDSSKGMEEFADAIGSLERAFSLIDFCRRHMAISNDVFIVEERSFDERSAALSGVLDELIQAFERKDKVLIGDLIEYEIAPETEALAKVIQQIKNSSKGTSH